MDRTVALKDDLVREAMEVIGTTDEREAIERAVQTFVSEHRRKKPGKNMFDLVGDVRLRDDYDYKKMRASDDPD